MAIDPEFVAKAGEQLRRAGADAKTPLFFLCRSGARSRGRGHGDDGGGLCATPTTSAAASKATSTIEAPSRKPQWLEGIGPALAAELKTGRKECARCCDDDVRARKRLIEWDE